MELLAHEAKQRFDRHRIQHLMEPGAEEMNAKVVAGEELAPPVPDKHAASGELPRVGNGVSKEQVDEQKNVVVALFDTRETAASRSLPRAGGARAVDAHLSHGIAGLLDGISIFPEELQDTGVGQELTAVSLMEKPGH
jgi:hypothetical protein